MKKEKRGKEENKHILSLTFPLFSFLHSFIFLFLTKNIWWFAQKDVSLSYALFLMPPK